ncbi:MAG: class I SAM-dependent methyltransferase [Candidatus Aenigmarchaeota archaeon]|nr:class I SAM-dependent methyltransferase [Candidatus Aenigmarchaeota archaeon]
MPLDHYHDEHQKREYQNDERLKARKGLFSLGAVDIKGKIYERITSDTEQILDVGCGNGDLLIYLKKKGFRGRLIGVDFNPGMLKPGIEESEREGLNIEFYEGSAEDLKFPSNTFDMVIAKHTDVLDMEDYI